MFVRYGLGDWPFPGKGLKSASSVIAITAACPSGFPAHLLFHSKKCLRPAGERLKSVQIEQLANSKPGKSSVEPVSVMI